MNGVSELIGKQNDDLNISLWVVANSMAGDDCLKGKIVFIQDPWILKDGILDLSNSHCRLLIPNTCDKVRT